ncbi:MAG TPA: 1,4-alpha-glucan branching protein GlgB [Polyangiaceae bacterium]|nr:1,4-alpha-glucan branching protein GlgB [Polyangiaceae bacterium]
MSSPNVDPVLTGDSEKLAALKADRLHDPHAVLGAHPARLGPTEGAVVRSWHPDAVGCTLLVNGDARPMSPLGDGVFAAFLPGARLPLAYRLRFQFADGATWEREDPYRFLPTVGELDQHLFGEGTHRRLWDVLGAHVRSAEGTLGTSFAVWAPNAQRVSLVGEFNRWDGRLLPMRQLGLSGIWELFVPGVAAGALYKFEIKTQQGALRIKTDPFAREMEHPPATASRVNEARHVWNDEAWLQARIGRDIRREPVVVYEVHLGSWARVPEEGNRWLTYREIAPRLVAHAQRLGFTHIELLPLAEHAFYPSWGYQVTGYYAPTARYGTPDDLRYFVDYCHQHGIGVIMDWVPAHFPKDDFSLRRFDGTALYEHEDVRRGEHPDWGTLIFNYGRSEVRNFLVANALYWLKEYHIDGLRVDAVASMLYLDYSRKEGEWVPNPYGGRENLDAITFLRDVNHVISEEAPGTFTVAEESTAWGGITRPPEDGGLGFTFKWNMGWMHDTLAFFTKGPVHRKHHVDQLTFAMLYEHTEVFINAISHDEVVHGKGTLIEKMPGDFWQKLANLRLLLTYQYTRPGKQLMFLGTEFAQHSEWNHDVSLDWHIAEHAPRRGLQEFVAELGKLYKATPALWRSDPNPETFEWIDCTDKDNTVMSYLRRDGADLVIVVFNFTPVPREDYRIGVPLPGRYVERLSTDDLRFGGSEFQTQAVIEADAVPAHARDYSIRLRIPPLGALILAPSR